MTDEHELDAELHAKVKAMCEEGDRLSAAAEYRAAVVKYSDAFDLLPEPKLDWEAAHWILTSIGDTLYTWGKLDAARRALNDAMRAPGALGNAFNHLRLGQVNHDLGDLDKAADELMRAYMAAGKSIFDDENPKYLEFLKTRAEI